VGGPLSRPGPYGEEKSLLSLPRIEPRLLGHPGHRLVAMPTEPFVEQFLQTSSPLCWLMNCNFFYKLRKSLNMLNPVDFIFRKMKPVWFLSLIFYYLHLIVFRRSSVTFYFRNRNSGFLLVSASSIQTTCADLPVLILEFVLIEILDFINVSTIFTRQGNPTLCNSSGTSVPHPIRRHSFIIQSLQISACV
jgi:hypothetical protein